MTISISKSRPTLVRVDPAKRLTQACDCGPAREAIDLLLYWL